MECFFERADDEIYKMEILMKRNHIYDCDNNDDKQNHVYFFDKKNE